VVNLKFQFIHTYTSVCVYVCMKGEVELTREKKTHANLNAQNGISTRKKYINLKNSHNVPSFGLYQNLISNATKKKLL
jgi:hypothetical protein